MCVSTPSDHSRMDRSNMQWRSFTRHSVCEQHASCGPLEIMYVGSPLLFCSSCCVPGMLIQLLPCVWIYRPVSLSQLRLYGSHGDHHMTSKWHTFCVQPCNDASAFPKDHMKPASLAAPIGSCRHTYSTSTHTPTSSYMKWENLLDGAPWREEVEDTRRINFNTELK